MVKSGDSSSHLKPKNPPPSEDQLPRRRPRRRAAWACCALFAILLLLLAVIALILALTVFKAREPKVTLVSATVDGVSPRVTLPAIRVEINITLDLDFMVYNPNRVSFTHGVGTAELFYRENKVGDAQVAPGRFPSRGSGHLYCRLTVEAERLAGNLFGLLREVVAGRVGLDAKTRLPGRVKFLGFIKRHVVTTSDCHVVVAFPNLKVEEQQCQQKTHL